MIDGISIREFARRKGVSEGAIRKAIRAGRIVTLPDGTLDPSLVDAGETRDQGAAGMDTGTGRGLANGPAQGRPVVVRRIERGSLRTFAGLIAAVRDGSRVDVVIFPFAAMPQSIGGVPYCQQEPGLDVALAAWPAG